MSDAEFLRIFVRMSHTVVEPEDRERLFRIACGLDGMTMSLEEYWEKYWRSQNGD